MRSHSLSVEQIIDYCYNCYMIVDDVKKITSLSMDFTSNAHDLVESKVAILSDYVCLMDELIAN